MGEYQKEFDRHIATQDRFEYFVLAAILAFLGFSIERFDPKDGEEHLILLFLSWLALLISLLAGLRRREIAVVMTRTSAQRFENLELLRPLREASLRGGTIATPAGTPWTQGKIRDKLLAAEEVEAKSVRLLDSEAVRAQRAYRAAYWSLLVGILAYAGFKIVNALSGRPLCSLF